MSNSVWIAAIALAAGISARAAEPVTWGAAADGLRLGVSLGAAAPEPELGVYLENLGAVPRRILIGSDAGRGTIVDFRFFATTSDGKRHEGFEIHSFTPIAGLVLPAVVWINAGATYEMHFPLKNIICVEKPGDIRFDALVKEGASILVSFGTDEKTAQWAATPAPWIGTMESGELFPPK